MQRVAGRAGLCSYIVHKLFLLRHHIYMLIVFAFYI